VIDHAMLDATRGIVEVVEHRVNTASAVLVDEQAYEEPSPRAGTAHHCCRVSKL
jgi:hypothetical protein